MNMSSLKQRLADKIPQWREEVRGIAKQHGGVSLGDTTIAKVTGGMRGLKSLVCDTSYLDPMEGIRFRGHTIPEVRKVLPKPGPDLEAYPTGLWYLLLTGELPTADEVKALEDDLTARSEVPGYTYDLIRALPVSAHPMTQFSAAILSMQPTSEFARQYHEGLGKLDYWKPTLDDALNLVARLPVIASYIYRRTYKNDIHIAADPTLDWGANFAHMMGVPDKAYQNLMRVYLLIHADHEGGNVSAHTSHVVGSALSDVYYSVSAGINGLAGPLHGLANQMCLQWINEAMEHFDGRAPTHDEARDYAWETLRAGRVIPGYGHAVLRNTDPRYTAQREYSLAHGMGEHPVVKTVHTFFDVVPGVLKEHGKAKSPWPNVDAHSGALQVYYGVTEADFYTVLFGVSRALGITSQLVWDRALGMPIERPKSVTVAMLRDAANG